MKIEEFSKDLHIDLEVKGVSTPRPIASFRIARKINDYLLRAKIYLLEQNVGSRKCNKSKCEVCNNIESTDLFSSTVTGETYKIYHYFNCYSKCLVYLIHVKLVNYNIQVRIISNLFHIAKL